ncbi:MAG: tRNA (adenosine(37)-N6)-dimethylallyltransferase MiaA [Patescibacteria group bacterium]
MQKLLRRRRLLIICGPTATGKTALALSLAKKFNGELISADSKQVYKGLDIGTGKDLPSQAKKEGYYAYRGIKIWGYDLVGPQENFSVSTYIRFAEKVTREALKKGKLPIIVGGTGLYIKALVDGIPTAKIPQNLALRGNLANKSTTELFEMLAQLDPIKAGSLNSSDRKNPRRLTRAIEIATWRLEGKGKEGKQGVQKFEPLFVGLTCPKEKLFQRIDKRVDARVRAGVEKEIKNLLRKGVSWESQSMSSLGYRQWRGYFEGKEAREEVINAWKKEERKYAKRQITWFKKDGRIKWFDIEKPNWADSVEKLVAKWYSSRNAKKN